jgi:RNA polymerase sigma-54 factor
MSNTKSRLQSKIKKYSITTMPLELIPTAKLTYKLKLTPQMKLSLNLLQLPLLKLKEFVERQIEENPLLDREDINSIHKTKGTTEEEKKNYMESLTTKPLTLQEHLLIQLNIYANPGIYETGETIIGNIDDNGYLKSSTEEIARSLKISVSKVEKVLSLIQTFDPIGAGARDLRECLLLQLKAKKEKNPLTYTIVDKYLHFLEKKRFDYIAKGENISIEKIKEALKEIAALEPKPGRSFNAEKTINLIPDVLLKKKGNNYEVIYNDWDLPSIIVNDKYKKMLLQKDISPDTNEYLKEKLKTAYLLINAIRKRKNTIREITKEIVCFQKGFLDKGISDFKPMTLEQIAKRTGKHKSTISRSVTGKYLQTPWGIFELRYFLNSGVKQKDGRIISSKNIKSKIKNLLENENKEKPLTDQKMTEHLNQQGISLTRRTVTKYRKNLKILSSQSRKR